MPVSNPALEPLARAIAALTYDEIERHEVDEAGRLVITIGEAIPLLQRSIAQDLVRIDRQLGIKGGLLTAIATAIDEALLAVAEARAALMGEAA